MDIHHLELILSDTVLVASHFLEACGAVVILYSGIKTFIHFIRTRHDGRVTRLNFARFLVFGLEFKLAGEILRTVIVRSMNEILVLAAVIALRFVLNLILHWEIHQEKRDEANESLQSAANYGKIK